MSSTVFSYSETPCKRFDLQTDMTMRCSHQSNVRNWGYVNWPTLNHAELSAKLLSGNQLSFLHYYDQVQDKLRSKMIFSLRTSYMIKGLFARSMNNWNTCASRESALTALIWVGWLVCPQKLLDHLHHLLWFSKDAWAFRGASVIYRWPPIVNVNSMSDSKYWSKQCWFSCWNCI